MKGERIPFEEAIYEKLLFKAAFDSLTEPQQVVLKAIYALPLRAHELEYWSAFNGLGEFDDLGYLTGVKGSFPYVAGVEFEDITLIMGRRWAKSTLSSFVIAYEAICGGHRLGMKNKKQDPIFLQVAQDLPTAEANLRQFIMHWLEMSPIGAAELKKGSQTAKAIRLSTGLITVGPPTIKLRSQAIAVCAMDELAVWPKDRESANPDLEVEIAVRPAMMQFPFRKLLKTSTPWSEEGLLWRAYQTGTYGYKLEGEQRRHAARVMVLRAPTATSENPIVTKAYLSQERTKDANAFLREYLAEFAKSVTGFLSPTLVRGSVTSRVRHRAPKVGVRYVATMDPAFRRDAFAFAIGHMEGGSFVLDFLDAPRGTKEAPLSPAIRMASIAQTCKTFGVKLITTDQHSDVALMELAQDFDLSVEPYYITAKIKQQVWGDFISLLNQAKVQLLDIPELVEEMLGMEKHHTPQGTIQIYGRRDDSATVVALCAHKALQMGEPDVAPEPEQVSQHMRIKRGILARARGTGTQWWQT